MNEFGKVYFETAYGNYQLQNPLRKLIYYRNLMEKCVVEQEHPRVLEIGCAFGKLLSILNPQWRRFGLDLSDYAINQARAILPECQFSVSSLDKIEFPGEFDIIVAFDVLEHVNNLDQAIQQIKFKMASNGYLILVVPVYDGPLGPLIRLLDKDKTHIHKESRYFWIDLISRYLQVVDWSGIYRYLVFGRYYVHLPIKYLRKWAPAIMITSQNIHF